MDKQHRGPQPTDYIEFMLKYEVGANYSELLTKVIDAMYESVSRQVQSHLAERQTNKPQNPQNTQESHS